MTTDIFTRDEWAMIHHNTRWDDIANTATLTLPSRVMQRLLMTPPTMPAALQTVAHWNSQPYTSADTEGIVPHVNPPAPPMPPNPLSEIKFG